MTVMKIIKPALNLEVKRYSFSLDNMYFIVQNYKGLAFTTIYNSSALCVFPRSEASSKNDIYFFDDK